MVCFPLIVCSPKLINDDFDTKFVVRNLKEQRPFLFYVRVGERMATARGALTVQVPAPSSGIIEKISVKEGQTVNVGALLGTIEQSKSKPVNASLEE